jgi:hypothetical protein
MIAAVLASAIDAATDVTDDRRKLLVVAEPSTVEQIRSQAPGFWRDLPSCFLGDGGIVGAFHGVPVLEHLGPPGVVEILLGQRVVGAISGFGLSGASNPIFHAGART